MTRDKISDSQDEYEMKNLEYESVICAEICGRNRRLHTNTYIYVRKRTRTTYGSSQGRRR